MESCFQHHDAALGAVALTFACLLGPVACSDTAAEAEGTTRPDLADGRPDGRASGTEWRTAPLWGIGLLERVSKHQMLLHDGRARGLAEAILWHGGESAPSRDRFRALAKAEREAVLAFLASL